MKIALVTTTINVPTVLALYAKHDPEVMMFVMGDRKTPDIDVVNFLTDNCPSHAYYGIDTQHALGYKCSPLIGENTDSRRNIAVLEALKWGADIVVSVDDDMIPLGDNFFTHIGKTLTQPFHGLQLGAPGQWGDVGALTFPPARQRGLPMDAKIAGHTDSVFDIRVGAMQGSILGVPDTDASTTAVTRPLVTGINDILRIGFVVDPAAKAVYNSQFTAFRREIAPAFAQFYPWQKRNTDIIASMIMRRIMRERGLHTYFGPPIGFHARKPRSTLKDMQAELWGMENIEAIAQHLDDMVLPEGESVVAQLRHIYQMPVFESSQEVMTAWCDDCTSVT